MVVTQTIVSWTYEMAYRRLIAGYSNRVCLLIIKMHAVFFGSIMSGFYRCAPANILSD